MDHLKIYFINRSKIQQSYVHKIYPLYHQYARQYRYNDLNNNWQLYKRNKTVPNSNNFPPHVTLRGRASSAGRYMRGSDLHWLNNIFAKHVFITLLTISLNSIFIASPDRTSSAQIQSKTAMETWNFDALYVTQWNVTGVSLPRFLILRREIICPPFQSHVPTYRLLRRLWQFI